MQFNYILAIVVIFLYESTYSTTVINDSIKIQGKLLRKNQFLNGSVYQFGIKKKVIRKFEIKEGSFTFSFPSTIEPGVYRLQFDESNEKSYVNLIVDGVEKNIVFDINLYDFVAIPVFKESIENIKWYAYLSSTTKSVLRLNGLFRYLSDFHDESVDRLVIKTYNLERENYYVKFSKFINDNKNFWCGYLVANQPYYFSNLKKEPVIRDFIRKNFFWEDIDTNNPKLINTPLYGDLISQYFDKYYINPIENYSSTQKEYNLKKGIDILLDKFSKNTLTKKFIWEYLKAYFNNLDNHEIVAYLNQKGKF